MQVAIETSRLTRYFDKKCVVRDLDFRVPAGQVTALLGLNGAGKTTTMRMIMGLLDPTRGHSKTLGVQSNRLRPEDHRRIGYMIEGHFLYSWMRVQDVARFQSAGHLSWDMSSFEAIVRHFGISAGQRVSQLSRGQRAGVSLAATIAASPELLVLDDPALGLDPVSRRALNETIVEFASKPDRTVLLSSHLIDDVERVADRVAVMIGGRLMVDCALPEFCERVTRIALRFAAGESQNLVAKLSGESLPRLIEARQVGDRLIVALADYGDDSAEAVESLGADEREHLPVSLDEAVLAYLSRERSGQSFIAATSS